MLDIRVLGSDVEEETLALLAALPCLHDEPHWTQAQLRDACMGSEQVLGLFVKGKAVGYIIGAQVLDQADIHTILVAVDWRAQGLAKQLLQAMLARLKQQGATQVFLEVRQGNLAAQGLYAGYGFSATGHRINYYANRDGSRENAIIMSAKV
jgi:ribosomal-protein-alanine N-acetyltransferase